MNEHVASPPVRVKAEMNYSFEGGSIPKIFNGQHDSNELYLASAQVEVINAHSLAVAPSLTSEGFTCVRHRFDPSWDLENPHDHDLYIASLRERMLELTGADEVRMLAKSAFRRQDPESASATGASPPILFVHSDYTVAGATQNSALYGEPGRTPNRTALYNMWRLLSPGPTDTPLALCDASTVEAADIIVGESHYPKLNDLTLETAFIKANDSHRWHFYPELGPDDLLVFKQGDSDGGQPRVVPHCAFKLRQNARVQPRISIESRCMAIWY